MTGVFKNENYFMLVFQHLYLVSSVAIKYNIKIIKFYESSRYSMATGKYNNIIVVAATIIITCVYSHRVRRIIASALPVGMVFTFFLRFDRVAGGQ